LADDQNVCEQIGKLIGESILEVLVSPTIHDELEPSRFRGVPNFFPVRHITEAAIIFGHTKFGLMRFGEGKMYEEHRGRSKQIKDAIIAEAAELGCNIFVSEDKRCRKRLKELGNNCHCFSYSEFVTWLFNPTQNGI
jgi:hypothetical protein